MADPLPSLSPELDTDVVAEADSHESIRMKLIEEIDALKAFIQSSALEESIQTKLIEEIETETLTDVTESVKTSEQNLTQEQA